MTRIRSACSWSELRCLCIRRDWVEVFLGAGTAKYHQHRRGVCAVPWNAAIEKVSCHCLHPSRDTRGVPFAGAPPTECRGIGDEIASHIVQIQHTDVFTERHFPPTFCFKRTSDFSRTVPRARPCHHTRRPGQRSRNCCTTLVIH